MKKIVSVIIVFFLFHFTAAAAARSTTIEFWTTETQSDRMKTIRLLMDTFQALNPDIQVKVVPVDENDMPSQMAAASAADKLPALIEGSSELMLAFGEEGILDIEGATRLVKQIGQDRFFHAHLDRPLPLRAVRALPEGRPAEDGLR